jgi:Peptidase A4 family
VAAAWTQWWARNDASTAPAPLGLAVDPGDEVACVVTAWNPRTVRCVMVNRSKHPHTGMAAWMCSPPVKLPDNTTTHPAIAGATAEWILERPAILHQTNRYDFPDYGEQRFHHCVAVEGRRVSIFAWPAGIPQELRGERLIRMFEVLPNPARTACISTPAKLTDRSIRLKYGSF